MVELVGAALRIVGLVCAALLAGVMLLILAFSADLHRKNEGRIQAALRSHYPGEVVQIRQRVARQTEWTAQFDNEICFAVEVVRKGGRSRAQHIAMVASDLDQGSWSFGAEYPSMADCRSHFFRG